MRKSEKGKAEKQMGCCGQPFRSSQNLNFSFFSESPSLRRHYPYQVLGSYLSLPTADTPWLAIWKIFAKVHFFFEPSLSLTIFFGLRSLLRPRFVVHRSFLHMHFSDIGTLSTSCCFVKIFQGILDISTGLTANRREKYANLRGEIWRISPLKLRSNLAVFWTSWLSTHYKNVKILEKLSRFFIISTHVHIDRDRRKKSTQ